MNLSKRLDQFLIYDQDKLNRRLFFLSLLFGPTLNFLIYRYQYALNLHFKLNVLVVVYISYLTLIQSFIRGVLESCNPILDSEGKARVFANFSIWYLALMGAGFLQTRFFYEPVLRYIEIRDIDSIVFTTMIYAGLAVAVFEFLKLEVEK